MKLARLHAAALTEPFWHVQLTLLIAIGLQFLLRPPLTLTSKHYVAATELLLLVALSLYKIRGNKRFRSLRRLGAFLLIFVVSAANFSSLILVVKELFITSVVDGRQLLLSALAIYLTNVIIFGLWYWELDTPEGGNATDAQPPDFLFPQMTTHVKREPTFFDYLYVSITNATAFSPTDTLPLTHRAKLLMALQSLTALATVALVAARAVNILQ